MESLSHVSALPWLCIGDFNEITSATEKAGSNVRPARQMTRFHDVIHFCGFHDLGFHGVPYTWFKNQPSEGHLRIRLDRALANHAWKSKFVGVEVHYVPMSTSDHSLLALRLPKEEEDRNRRGQRMFRFEAMCDEVVQEAWYKGLCKPGGYPFTNCINICRSRLQVWNKMEFGHVGRKIAGLEKQLKRLELLPGTKEINDEIMEVRKALNVWLDAESTMWQQRSRNLWLTSGDRNTSFFHAKASNIFQRNIIHGLCDETGTWKEDDRSIEQTTLNYFSMIFRSNGPTNHSKVVEAIQSRISTIMNESLLHAFTAEEMSKALKQMHPKKAPGPDGMPPLFYQHFWPLVSNLCY